MHRNRIIYLLILMFLSVSIGLSTSAQTESSQTVTPGGPSSAPNVVAPKNKAKKKIKINFEDENITGNYDVPDTLFLNSRRLVKYKELFNKRTNFIEEIESNKGLFNEHQK